MIVNEYIPILIFILVSIGISILILIASYIIAILGLRIQGDNEKLSPYECGFNPFQDARQEFDVKFYLVAILFIIFDIEISFLFPWAVTITEESYWSMIIFLGILTIGFIYEWLKGALKW